METSELFATPGRTSYQVIHPSSSSGHRSKGNDASMSSYSNAKSASSFADSNRLAPPVFHTHSFAKNDLQVIRHKPENDPFISTGYEEKYINIKKLSPTATPFKPRQLFNVPLGAVRQVHQSTPSDRVFETPSGSSIASEKISKELGTPGTIQTTEGIFEYVYPAGEFASGRHTRYLSITGVPEHLPMNTIQVLIKGKTYRGPSAIIEGGRSPRLIFLAFFNIVDSVNAAGEIPNKHSTWSLDFVNARDFSEALVHGSGMFTSVHKGQLTVTATRYGPRATFFERDILACLSNVMKNYGIILAWEVLSVTYPSVYVRMEYYDTRDSERAKVFLDGNVLGALQLYVTDYAPDIPIPAEPVKAPSMVTTGATDDDFNTMVDGLTHDQFASNFNANIKLPLGYLNTPRSGLSTASERTITTQAYIPSTNRFITNATPYSSGFPVVNEFAVVPHGRGTALGFPTAPAYSFDTARMLVHGKRLTKVNYPGGNNVVNPYRIAQGQDVRTTIMLRNIPNKMPQSELKQFIDETNHGEYDFMYLRIDFANNCNVGYAFINFIDPLAIVKFVKARAGTKWLHWHSDKVAEISYATIQGKDCLIQKFRNSSVMLEDPSFRPKLYYAGTGPMAGKEEPFPGPDNDSKLRRSIENAGAVGLFAPRAGQYFRESQRRRRSQFDRGTNLAQIEESTFVEGGYNAHNSTVPMPTGSQSAPAHRMMF